MNDKVEWELVEEDPSRREGERPPPRPPTAREALKAMLGPWWRWKLAGLIVLGAVALVIVTAVAGVLVVSGIALALVMFAVSRVRNWLRGGTGIPDHYR